MDGIGHYTASLAETLRRLDPALDITVFAPDGLGDYDPINGKPVRREFRVDDISTCNRLLSVLRDEKPDWVLLQYQAFAYGKWGRNPVLTRVMREARATIPGLRLATMVHEVSVVVNKDLTVANAKRAVFATWQRQQFRDLARTSDVVFMSTESFIREYAGWFPDKTLHQSPIGSSMPYLPLPGGNAEAKARLGIPDDHLVVGLFGTAHSSRMNDLTGVAVDAVREAGRKPFVLYVGPDPAKYAAMIPPLVPSLVEGPFPPEEVSRRLQAMDIYLSLFMDGVAARRTSFITPLQHGLPVVGVVGVNTDGWIRDGGAFAGVMLNEGDARSEERDGTFVGRFAGTVRDLASDDRSRGELGRRARVFFEERFAWERIARDLLGRMRDA